MKSKWREIWEKRAPGGSGTPALGELIALNGFDSGAGFVSVDDWRANARAIATRIDLAGSDSVYEIGCGAGALLYALLEIKQVEIGGIDYSHALISAARKAIPAGDFTVGEALETKSKPVVDWVIAHGVFHYLDLAYAERVLAIMTQKAAKGVAVLEVPDAALRTESEIMRRGKLSPGEYEKKYAGLEHTYFDRAWFTAQAATLGASFDFFSSFIPNSTQSPYRFNFIMHRSQSVSR
jgi:trans-aconitate methyltransferase